VSPALPGEGVWAPAGQVFGGEAPILETTLHPDSLHPSVVAGLAWIDTSQIQLSLVPGLSEPESSLAHGPGVVPQSDRSRLLATFNSGFKTKDGEGGFIADGKSYVSPKEGLGTLVVYRGGEVDIGEWGREIKPSSDISYLRQNLPLIVDGGITNPQLSDPAPLITPTVKNDRLTWRSGIGIDTNGGLIYAAAEKISAQGLADLLVQAGAVKAMALDENSALIEVIHKVNKDAGFIYYASGSPHSTR
jgi:hypothetical protein